MHPNAHTHNSRLCIFSVRLFVSPHGFSFDDVQRSSYDNSLSSEKSLLTFSHSRFMRSKVTGGGRGVRA
jgi:hypothetical protein